MAVGADPRAAREIELANLAKAKANKKAAVLPQVAALLAAALKAEADENHAALTGRARVNAVDRQAAQQRAEAEAAAQAEGGEPVDITQFYPQVQINPGAPTPGQAPSFAELAQAGGSANAIANRTVAPARQAAGTLPSAAPRQQPGAGGGPPGMSIDVAGQTFTAPDTITTTQETTGPFQFGPGLFVPATTRETVTTPNVLSAGDLLQAKLQYDAAQQARLQQAGQFMMTHALQTTEARVTMANQIRTTTNAPPSLAWQVAGAYLDGNDEIGNKLLQGYDTTGAAGIAAERRRAAYWSAKQQETEQKLKLGPMSLYQIGPFLGLGQVEVPPTGNAALATERSIRAGLSSVYSTDGVTFNFGFARKGGTDASRASAIMTAGREAGRLNSVLTFERTSDDSDEYVLDFANPQEIIALYHLATGNSQGFKPHVKQRAAEILERKGLGGIDEAGNLDPSLAPPVLQPWARKVRETYEAHRGAPDYQINETTRLSFPDAILDAAGGTLQTKYPELFAPPPKAK